LNYQVQLTHSSGNAWELPRAHSIEKGKVDDSEQAFFVTMTNFFDDANFPTGTTDKVTILILEVD